MSSDKKSLLKRAKGGETAALAKLLSLVEADLRDSARFLSQSKPSKSNCVRLGITGPPGAGKSSLVNLFIKHFRSQNQRVGVLAIDPSSPFSGGALLGDRVRMNEHTTDNSVFIRSIGSRGGMGGLSAATGAMARVLELCGFDIIIIETVGVGQTELEVMNLADATSVVLVPESGDVVQTLKAGILEIADLFVVNKCDRSGAESLAQELRELVHQEKLERKVFLTSTLDKTKGDKIEAVLEEFVKCAQSFKKDKRSHEERLRGELRALVMADIDKKLRAKISKLKITDVYKAYLKFHS